MMQNILFSRDNNHLLFFIVLRQLQQLVLEIGYGITIVPPFV